MISPAIAAIAALGGYVVYKEVKGAEGAAAQPNKAPPNPFQSDYYMNGNQPATGNGAPNIAFDQTGKDIGNALTAGFKFGTSLLEYFGTSTDEGNDFGGGVSANSNQTSQFSNGSDPGEWSLPAFD